MTTSNKFDIQTLHSQFKQKFWDGFHKPNLKSDKYKEIWQQLEPSNNWLVGPLYSVYENANFDYLFHDKERFAAVNTLNDFLEWANEIVANYKLATNAALPNEEAEKQDLDLLNFQIHIKSELIAIASLIQSKNGFIA